MLFVSLDNPHIRVSVRWSTACLHKWITQQICHIMISSLQVITLDTYFFGAADREKRYCRFTLINKNSPFPLLPQPSYFRSANRIAQRPKLKESERENQTGGHKPRSARLFSNYSTQVHRHSARRYVVSPLPKCAKRPQFVAPAHAARQSKQRGSAAARLTAKLPNHYFPPNCHFYLLLSCFNWSLTALNTVSVTISISRQHFIIRTSITQRILIDKVC